MECINRKGRHTGKRKNYALLGMRGRRSDKMNLVEGRALPRHLRVRCDRVAFPEALGVVNGGAFADRTPATG